jgi:hypothetical protein
MKDEYISLDAATPESWDKVSAESSAQLQRDHQRAWELEMRTMAYGRPEDYVDSDEPIDVVNKPSHYLDVPEKYEHHRVMDAIGANYHFSNAMKYLWRAGKKSSNGMTIENKEIQDVRKSIRYLEMWIEIRTEARTKEEMDAST